MIIKKSKDEVSVPPVSNLTIVQYELGWTTRDSHWT